MGREQAGRPGGLSGREKLMETWRLEHPEVGTIEVHRGYDAEFAEMGQWPKKAKDFTAVPGDATLPERFRLWRKNPSPRLQIVVNGQVRSRHDRPRAGRYSLKKKIEKDLTLLENSAPRTKPYLDIQASPFGELLDVYYRNGEEAVALEPPAGSLGEKRRHAMKESSFKRVLYPLLGGLGKSGWAIGVIVLGPIISRILSRLLPDWELPDIDLPDIALPVPELPQIELPVPNFDFNIDIDPPDWLVFLMDYSKVWVPLIIAIVVGIQAVRNAKKSEEKKHQWQQNGAYADGHEDSRRD